MYTKRDLQQRRSKKTYVHKERPAKETYKRDPLTAAPCICVYTSLSLCLRIYIYRKKDARHVTASGVCAKQTYIHKRRPTKVTSKETQSLSVSVYTHVYLSLYIHMYSVSVCTHASPYMYIHMYIHMCIHLMYIHCRDRCTQLNIYIYVYIYTCIHIYMYTYIHVYPCIYTCRERCLQRDNKRCLCLRTVQVAHARAASLR